MSALLQVAIGGALGASARYLTGIAIVRLIGQTPFPVAIILVNVLGSFLMGVFVILATHRGMTQLAPFVMTGLLGGFTTFSAFSLEAATLWERGATGQAAIYVVASVALSIAGLVAGLTAARAIFT